MPINFPSKNKFYSRQASVLIPLLFWLTDYTHSMKGGPGVLTLLQMVCQEHRSGLSRVGFSHFRLVRTATLHH